MGRFKSYFIMLLIALAFTCVIGVIMFFAKEWASGKSELVRTTVTLGGDQGNIVWTTESLTITFVIRLCMAIWAGIVGIAFFSLTVSYGRKNDNEWLVCFIIFMMSVGGLVIATCYWPVGEEITVDYESQYITKANRYLLPIRQGEIAVAFSDVSHIRYRYGEWSQPSPSGVGVILLPHGVVEVVKHDGSTLWLHGNGYENRQLAEEVSEAIGKPLETVDEGIR